MITWVINLTSDRLPKQEVNVNRSRKCSHPNSHERNNGVGNLLGQGRSKVFFMLAAGELPVIPIGRSVRVPRAALERWVAECTHDARVQTRLPVPLLAEIEDRDAIGGPARALLARDLRRGPTFDPRRASSLASSGASS